MIFDFVDKETTITLSIILVIWILSKFKTYLNKYPTIDKLLNEVGNILLDGLIIVMFLMFVLSLVGILFLIYVFTIEPYI